MHDIKSSRVATIRKVQIRKAQERAKVKEKARTETVVVERGNKSSNASMSQAGTRSHKPMPPLTRHCLKCGSRDHESGKCPKNREHRSYKAHAKNFTAWCLGPEEMNFNSVTAEVFSCENLTDTVGRVEAIEAIIDKSQDAFGTDHDWVSVDANDRPVYKFGFAKRNEAVVVQGQSESATRRSRGTIFMCMPRKRKECLYCCLPSHSLRWEQSSTSRRVMRSFVIWNLKPWHSWNTVLRDTCGWICLNKCQWSVIIFCHCRVP